METNGQGVERSEIKKYGSQYTQYVKFPYQKKARQAWATSEAELTAKVDSYVARETAAKAEATARQVARREQEKADRTQAAGAVKVGDIYVNTWGYDQTNVDYYKVTEVKGKMATLNSIGQKLVEGSEGFMSERVLPDPDLIQAKAGLKKVIQGNAAETYFSMGHGVARKFDGKPSYQSHYA